jgi:hypothetical protein
MGILCHAKPTRRSTNVMAFAKFTGVQMGLHHPGEYRGCLQHLLSPTLPSSSSEVDRGRSQIETSPTTKQQSWQTEKRENNRMQTQIGTWQSEERARSRTERETPRNKHKRGRGKKRNAELGQQQYQARSR